MILSHYLSQYTIILKWLISYLTNKTILKNIFKNEKNWKPEKWLIKKNLAWKWRILQKWKNITEKLFKKNENTSENYKKIKNFW